MSFDYSEFRRLRNNFARLTSEFNSWIYAFLLREGEHFIRVVKRRTPVDTGDLRSHWAIQGITRQGDNLQVEIVNPMHYASFVEYGHAKPYKAGASPGSADWVDGYFMMTVSVQTVIKQMPARFRKEFDVFLASLEVK